MSSAKYRSPRWVLAGALAMSLGCFEDVPPVADDEGADTSGPGEITTNASTSNGPTTNTDQTSVTTTSDGSTTAPPDSTTSNPATSSATGSSDATGSTSSAESDSSTGPRVCPTFTDAFEGPLGDGWILTQPESVSVVGGELRLELTSETGDFVSARRDGIDLSVAQVRFELGDLPIVPGVQFLFNVFTPQQDRLLFIVQEDSLNFRRGEPGNPALINLGTVPLDPAEHRWLRFDIDDTTVSFETSPDGSTWTTQHDEIIDWSYFGSSVGISASNFTVLGAAQTVSVRSVDYCLQ